MCSANIRIGGNRRRYAMGRNATNDTAIRRIGRDQTPRVMVTTAASSTAPWASPAK
jgi:hypothetical protein